MKYIVRKVRADVEGKLKRRKFKFQFIKFTFIKLYKLVGTNFPDNPIEVINIYLSMAQIIRIQL